MHRIDGPAAAPGGLFTDGDPNVGTPATVVTDDWLNAVQEEVVAVIGAAGIALSKPSNTQLVASLGVLIARAVPPGAVQAFAMASVPAGWLACNGSTVSRSAYPALFAAVGVVYGTGDGSTTFGLPDLRGEFIRGADAGRGVDAGRTLGSAQSDLLRSHTHVVSLQQLNSSDQTGSGKVATGNSSVEGTIPDIDSGATGGAETRPRNVAMNYCIRT